MQPSHRRNCVVTIERKPGLVGSGLNLFLDGNHIARLAVGEVITVYLKPGPHLLVAKPLFSPPASLRLHLPRGAGTSVRIFDRNGIFEMKAGKRSLAP